MLTAWVEGVRSFLLLYIPYIYDIGHLFYYKGKWKEGQLRKIWIDGVKQEMTKRNFEKDQWEECEAWRL